MVGAIFLTIVSYNLFAEGLERIYQPIEKSENGQNNELIYVSLAGFIIHIFGLYLFSQNENGATN